MVISTRAPSKTTSTTGKAKLFGQNLAKSIKANGIWASSTGRAPIPTLTAQRTPVPGCGVYKMDKVNWWAKTCRGTLASFKMA